MSSFSGKKQIKKLRLVFGNWNVRTLYDSDASACPERRTALVARELLRYGIDVAALSETKLSGEGQLSEQVPGYTFFWMGKSEDDRREAGVGFAVKTCLLSKLDGQPRGISERIMVMRLCLARGQYATLLSVYAPTMTHTEDSKASFYDSLRNCLKSIPQHDKVILMGDFNARVGCSSDTWTGVLGPHGIGKMNSNGLLLLSLCQELRLAVTNTMFQLKNIHKGTWMHPRSRTWHMLDYIIVRQRDMRDVCITRVMRGADCWTDHRLVRSFMYLKLRSLIRPQCNQLPKRLNADELLIPAIQQTYQETLVRKIEGLDPVENLDVLEHWNHLKCAVYSSATSVVGIQQRRHRDWFDESDELIRELLKEKHSAHQSYLRNPSSQQLHQRYCNIRSNIQTVLRAMRDNWWAEKAREIQMYADTRDMKKFYSALKEVYGPRSDAISPVLSLDGQQLLVEKDKILSRWAEHFNHTLNSLSTIDVTTFANLPQLPTNDALGTPPSVAEVRAAISAMQNAKAPGSDGIPVEALKAGGFLLSEQLTKLYSKMWEQGVIPNDFKDASVVHLFKRKGSKSICDNHRGISLLSVPGKVLSKVIATRLYKSFADSYLSESQCGFRRNRGCIDMIFTARQLLEKCREQHVGLCATFIDLTKAFDSVNREGLWILLSKLGCPEKFLKIIREFHDGMNARVIEQGLVSDSFSVQNGVKQGCTMAPILFALFFAAMLHDAFHDTDIGVYIQYRTSGKLYNLRRFQARTKVLLALIRDLLFADDCGLFTHTVEDMQILMNRFAVSAKRFGLTISIKKTQVMFVPPRGTPYVPPVITVDSVPLQVVDQFTYLGSTISANHSIDAEITNRIAKASSSFGALTSRLWNVRGIKQQTKLAVYHAVVLPTLLYAAESWTYYRRHIRQLDGFHMSCLRRILNIKWQDKISNVEVLQRAQSVGIESILMKMKLRWAGHLVRMDDSRLPKQVFYSQLKAGKRNPGGQLLRFKDCLKTTLHKCEIDVNHWEEMCGDRSGWRHLIHSGVDKFEKERTSALAVKRMKRKLGTTVNSLTGVFPCVACGKQCQSRIGLVGHMRVHRKSPS